MGQCFEQPQALLVALQDKESAEYQRLTWDALRKSINGLVNKVNTSNIKFILPEFFSEVQIALALHRAPCLVACGCDA